MVNKISGVSILILGILLSVLGMFLSVVFAIYGGIFIIIGIFVLVNTSEDKIEQIKFLGGKK
jgi:drug/metabolite transporter superfamily protein YnfA